MPRTSKIRSRRRAGVERDDDIQTMERRLKITTLMNELVELVENEDSISSADKSTLKKLQTRIQFAITAGASATPALSIPQLAPAKWLERKNKDETPLDFIRRGYAPWLGKGLSKPDIRRLDRSLYLAIYTWTRAGGVIPPDFDLPTRKQVNDAELKRRGFSSGQLDPDTREAMRLYHVMKGRDRRPR
jgi:hypothetical protein